MSSIRGTPHGSAIVTLECPLTDPSDALLCGADVEIEQLADNSWETPTQCNSCRGHFDDATRAAFETKAFDIIDNYDPTPYCHGGHRGAKDCDCGPIARND